MRIMMALAAVMAFAVPMVLLAVQKLQEVTTVFQYIGR